MSIKPGTRLILSLTAVALALCLPHSSRAADSLGQVPAVTLHPSPGPNGILQSDTARILGHLQWYVGLWGGYSNDLLRVRMGGDTIYRAVHHQVTGELSAGLGLFGYAELSVAMPLVPFQDDSGDPARVGLTSPEKFAVGDLRIIPRIRFWKDKGQGFGLSLVPLFTVPTGFDEDYAGEKFMTFEPRLVADYRFVQGTVIALNLGYRLRKDIVVGNLRVGDEFIWSLGAEVPVWQGLSILGDAWGSVGFKDTDADEDKGIDQEEIPLEVGGGLRYRFGFGLQTTLMGSAGLSNGWGTPDFRVFAGIVFSPPVKAKAEPKGPSDRDQDGIEDSLDQCPDRAEDKDGFEDHDGCPDLDNDKDGIADTQDKCPDKAEDKDGFEDDDGCPDLDNDKDGIADTKDKCPDKVEDKDGFEDDDGCPDPDNDHDGVCDPNETIQGNLSAYSCRGKDACPDKPETINGIKDEDGCPEKIKATVRVVGKKIEILKKVYFKTNKATIMKRSYAILRAVAAILRANPQVKLVRIEGHTDDRGSAKANLDLSQRRAESVRTFLIELGISASRLEAKGYGEDKPVQPNCRKLRGRRRRKACWAKNRRVEFHIIQTDGQSGAVRDSAQ